VATLVKVTDLGDDVLQIDGLDADGNPVTVTGWVSAMTNYFPPTAYDANGLLKASAKARAMTDAEKRSYWLSLLGEVAVPESSGTVIFQA
jgi:hypothetical protein